MEKYFTVFSGRELFDGIQQRIALTHLRPHVSGFLFSCRENLSNRQKGKHGEGRNKDQSEVLSQITASQESMDWVVDERKFVKKV